MRSRSKVWWLAALALCVIALSPGSSYAQSFGVGRLISPGELASSHKELDGITNCIECHNLKGGVNEEKCLECHKDIGALINQGKGYHSHQSVRQGKCIKCHPDHKGRKFFMIVWERGDRDNFDHDPTGYSLKDKHKIKECEKCHTKKTKHGKVSYLGLEQGCLSCHKDVHKKTLGGKCDKCHDNFRSWKGDDVKFDHDKQAKYPLVGKHARAKCEKCHVRKARDEAVFKVENFELCVACHKKDDVHKGALGDKCEKCHVEENWKKVRFNHDKTKYPLVGKHLDEKCESCHPEAKKGQYKIARYDTCAAAGCHDVPARGAVHGRQFVGRKCDECHSLTKGWTPVLFAHDDPVYKGFKLKGKHAKVKCEKCHPSTGELVRYKKARMMTLFKPIDSSKCDNPGCHDSKKRGNIHGKQFAGRKCEECHSEENWKPTLFAHDDPAYKGFKLDGKHAKLECGKCHEKSWLGEVKYKPIKYETCDTQGCHDTKKRGNIHGKQFIGRKCDECHNTSDWKPPLFKHDDPAYKGYKLEGRHAEVKCESCHAKDWTGEVKFKPIDTALCTNSGCHDSPERGNIHGKQFAGMDCAVCHTVKDWKPAAFKHEDSKYKGFKLEGKHAELKCDKCHKEDLSKTVAYKGKEIHPAVYKPIAYDRCDTKLCHPDPHKKIMEPRKCEECHTERDWKDMTTRFDHTFDTKYPLTGKHKNTGCEKCHTGKRWKPIEQDCVNCHRKDDKHKGKYGQECMDCHNTANWQPKSIAHEMTGFPLTQTHAQLVCADCHTKGEGDFSGLGPDCTQCHTDPHFNQMGRLCNDCHTMRNWEPMKFRHSFTGFRLEGAHRFTDCKNCHQNRIYRNVPVDCFSCHRDVFFSPAAQSFHDAGATNCTDCHSVYSWIPARGISHKTMTFTGGHARIKNDCAKCHVTQGGARYALRWPGAAYEQDCYTCHMTDYARQHRTCPQTCELCHNTSGWGGVRTTIPCD